MEELAKIPFEKNRILIIREMGMFFRYAQPADKYTNEYENEPNDIHLEEIEKEITKFLKNYGSLVMEARRPLPFIEEGFITPPIVRECYSLENPKDKSPYLVFLNKQPYGGFYNPGWLCRIMVVSYKEDKDKADELLDRFKSITYQVCGVEKWSDIKTKFVSTTQIQSIEDILALLN